jgi:predicted DNA-binding protein YlxM (UPF0122 family)
LAKTANFGQIFQKKLQNPLDKGQGFWYTPSVKQKNFTTQQAQTAEHRGSTAMAKDLEMGYLLDFYGEVLTQKQREMLRQYYNDDLSLSEIGENFGITRQGARDAIKHGETTLKELEEKVGFAARYRRVQQKLEQLEQLVIDTRFECTGPRANITTTEYVETLTKMLELIRSMDEANES